MSWHYWRDVPEKKNVKKSIAMVGLHFERFFNISLLVVFNTNCQGNKIEINASEP